MYYKRKNNLKLKSCIRIMREATYWRHLVSTLARQAIIFAKGHNT